MTVGISRISNILSLSQLINRFFGICLFFATDVNDQSGNALI